MQTRKHTAWKKNRRFGDIKGGRCRLKCKDGIFNRMHSFLKPSEFEETPIFIVENPSRDFYFPVSVDDIKDVLYKLPKEHTEHLTHIWLRKIKKKDYLSDDSLQGCFIVGRGVYLIVLHPFPKDNRMIFGKKKPLQKSVNFYKNYTNELRQDKDGFWYLQWTESSIRRYYLESLLLHEIGHSIDSFYTQFWSKAKSREQEVFANSYASFWGTTIREKYHFEENNKTI